jgi:hypothetical protein
MFNIKCMKKYALTARQMYSTPPKKKIFLSGCAYSIVVVEK